MKITRTVVLSVLVTILSLCPFAYQLHAQVPAQDLASMAGPWECKDSNGIHGLSLIATTRLFESGDLQNIPSLAVSFRIYQRQGGQERWGYFSTSDPGGTAVLDSNHLTIHFKIQSGTRPDIPPFDMDVRFDSARQQWTGMWSLCNTPAGAVLERPHLGDAVQANALVGDWKGSQEPKTENVLNGLPEAAATLHIRQSSDGKLIGWVDLFDYLRSTGRNGEEVLFRSSEPDSIAFGIYDSVPVAHAEYRYEGKLSADRITLTGKWRISGGGVLNSGGRETQVPTLFRRIN